MGTIVLDHAIGDSLGYDAAARELYALLIAPEAKVGVCDESGRLLRTLPVEAPYLDVGPRSFVRVF
ncbi:MAG: hypothetical protein EXS38_11675 [Opitutus sp.]|nr:hypothetical protein [Opitutus sp.]